MNEPKFTPGPLFVRQPEKWPFNIEIVDTAGELVFEERRYAYSTSHESLDDVMSARGFKGDDKERAVEANERQLADAYLRAASPDLLEVAREALMVIKAIKPPSHGNGTIVRLEDAIAKALGQN